MGRPRQRPRQSSDRHRSRFSVARLAGPAPRAP